MRLVRIARIAGLLVPAPILAALGELRAETARVSHKGPRRYLPGFVAGITLVASVTHATPPLPPPLLWPTNGLNVSRQQGDQWTGDVASFWSGAFVAWVDQSQDTDSIDLY